MQEQHRLMKRYFRFSRVTEDGDKIQKYALFASSFSNGDNFCDFPFSSLKRCLPLKARIRSPRNYFRYKFVPFEKERQTSK